MKTWLQQYHLAALVVLVLCFFYVWPGVYRYEYTYAPRANSDTISVARGGPTHRENVIRMDRLTGNVQKLTKGNPGREHWVNHHP